MSKSSSKRVTNQHRRQQQQPAEADDPYDEYVYYQYAPKTAADGGYEYLPEGEEYEERGEEQYYEDNNHSAPLQRT